MACGLLYEWGVRLVHMVARMRWPFVLFTQREHAAWTWKRLRAAFPHTVAACLMPNHVHLATLVEDPIWAREQLARTCGHLQRKVAIPRLFEPVPDAEVVQRKKTPRMLRYVELNACRASLIRSPLGWEWSTLRDVVGAVADPWVDGRLHARVTGIAAGRWLDYVMADDRVKDRTPALPAAPAGGRDCIWGLGSVARAAAAVFRADPSAIRSRSPARRLFLALAWDQGLRATRQLAEHTQTNPTSVRRSLARPVPASWLTAARRCLADPRLTSGRSDRV